MTITRRLGSGALTVGLLLAAAVGACGGGDDQTSGRDVRQAERAFLQGMVPHHRSAIEMAKMAKKRGRHADIRDLAGDIIASQGREIDQMKQIHERLVGKPLEPDPMAHEKLGLSPKQAGMDHMNSAAAMLERARPFDRAFIDEMVSHHQGAIRMARAVVGKTRDPELWRLAQSIVGAQSREIVEMSDWRKRWYGAASPSGGVPSGPSGGGGGDHEGHQM